MVLVGSGDAFDGVGFGEKGWSVSLRRGILARQHAKPAPFKVNENFVVTLTAPEEQDPQDNHYLVTIAIEGRSSNDCYGVNHKPPFVDDDAVLGCDVLGHTYVFNFDNHRFIEIYKATSYVDGSNNDTPHVAGGLCTKISQ